MDYINTRVGVGVEIGNERHENDAALYRMNAVFLWAGLDRVESK